MGSSHRLSLHCRERLSLDDRFGPNSADHGTPSRIDVKSVLAVASTAIQLIYVLSLLGAILSAVKLFQSESVISAGDPKLMAGAISTIILDFLIGAVIGFVGVLMAWLVLREKEDRPSWFLPVSTYFAWAWIVFIPIGTVIGILMLRWGRTERTTDTAKDV